MQNMLKSLYSWIFVKSEGHYRSDLDGLRAVAVIAVVLFHAYPKLLPGGFIGVDVFFTLSGFFISKILYQEFEKGTFSYSRFMAKRIRRIVPALAVVMFSCFCFGWYTLMKDEFVALGEQLVAGVFFSANILFYLQADYFDTAAEFKPLLHLWSLGVEEQFYLVWPLMIWAAYRLRFSLLLPTLTLFTFSLLACLYVSHNDRSAAFYLLHTRFWELLLGALAAQFYVYWPKKVQWLQAKQTQWLNITLANVLSLTGVAFIWYGIRFTTKDGFPGAWPVFPTVGTLFLIMAGPNAWFNRSLLSFRGMVFIGLISYPLYLWHWPLISFGYILSSARPPEEYIFFALVASVLLSVVTYYGIEQFTKRASTQFSYRYILPALPLAAAMGLVAIQLHHYEGRKPDRMNELTGVVTHEEFHEFADRKYFPCAIEKLRKASDVFGQRYTRCHQSQKSQEYDLLILGDSHAEHLFYGLAEQLPHLNIVYLIQLGLPIHSNKNFSTFFSFIRESYTAAPIIYTAQWLGHPTKPDQVASTIKSLIDLGKTVYITDDIPYFFFQPKNCAVSRTISLVERQCDQRIDQHRLKVKAALLASIKEKVASPKLRILDTDQHFIEGQKAFMSVNRQVLYRDNHHLAEQMQNSGQLSDFSQHATLQNHDQPKF